MPCLAVMSKMNNKKSEREIANEKSERIMQGVAAWTSFYRANPQRFVKDYLNVNLKLFQKILIYMMMLSNYFMYIAARGLKATPFSNVWMIRAENR